MEFAQDGAICNFQGVLVNCEECAREVFYSESLTRKRRINNPDTLVIHCLFVDRTGAVNATIWGAPADNISRAWQAYKRRIGQKAPPVVDMQEMRILKMLPNAWNGNVLTRIRNLGTVDQCSCIKFLDTATTESLLTQAYMVPSGECCVRDFADLKKGAALQSRFRVSLMGRVVDLQPLERSPSGQEKRNFNLVDGNGLYIPVCAMYLNALSFCLKEDSEIVVYYGTGRGAIGKWKGMVWCYRDSMIIPTGKTFPQAASSKREELVIRSAT